LHQANFGHSRCGPGSETVSASLIVAGQARGFSIERRRCPSRVAMISNPFALRRAFRYCSLAGIECGAGQIAPHSRCLQVGALFFPLKRCLPCDRETVPSTLPIEMASSCCRHCRACDHCRSLPPPNVDGAQHGLRSPGPVASSMRRVLVECFGGQRNFGERPASGQTSRPLWMCITDSRGTFRRRGTWRQSESMQLAGVCAKAPQMSDESLKCPCRMPTTLLIGRGNRTDRRGNGLQTEILRFFIGRQHGNRSR